MIANVEDRAVIHAVFKDPDSLVAMLKTLKVEDLGLSVVVSGLFEKVRTCCRQAGIEGHTVNHWAAGAEPTACRRTAFLRSTPCAGMAWLRSA